MSAHRAAGGTDLAPNIRKADNHLVASWMDPPSALVDQICCSSLLDITDFHWKSGGGCYEGFHITSVPWTYMAIYRIYIYGTDWDVDIGGPTPCMGIWKLHAHVWAWGVTHVWTTVTSDHYDIRNRSAETSI